MLEFYDPQFVTLRTIATGARQKLVHGSPNSASRLLSSFFLKFGDGYELHFCTVKHEKGVTINSWYRWYIGQDFLYMLNKYGRLPLEMTVEKLI